ncbi:hypothetical protein L6164_035314 [Bauhinia variegata]|uniref:Uncharacterized protein n=1 Tax=Bauhinia variegata TaxID=167791 RepID=A0ACB9KDJ4_BAUVA|nr:hypothetical protein L6164_035314 [Bauhinia variegata]
MNTNNASGGGGGAAGRDTTVMMGIRSPFTVSQWQELEHQALIYKYMMAGLPVPPDLVLPIQKSFEPISQRFLHHPTMSYCSLYGKKVDPEPGRCRRTDGKKWRCSKDAYPDSKYCERHMHRGRNRSRKPVESQTMMQPSSAVTGGSSASATGNFQNIPTNAFGNTPGTGTNQPRYHLDSIPYGIPSKEYRYAEGIKSEGEGGEHGLFSEALSSWTLIPGSFCTSKSSNSCVLQSESDYPQNSYSASGSGEGVKLQAESLGPLWPKSSS